MADELEQQTVGQPPIGESCSGCKFMIQRGTEPNQYCECHAHPPPTLTSQWSKVAPDDWCGEFVKAT